MFKKTYVPVKIEILPFFLKLLDLFLRKKENTSET